MAQTEGFCCLSRLCIYMTNSCPTVGGFEDPGPSETGVPDVIDRTDMILSADIASVDALDSGRASSRFRPQYDQRVQSFRIRWMLAVVMSDRTPGWRTVRDERDTSVLPAVLRMAREVTVNTAKARRELGYAPVIDGAAGMAALG